MTNRAQYEIKSAALSTEFGYTKAVEWFGQDAVDAMPVYVRGKNAGKPKGFYCWTKVVRGGWVSNGGNNGYVENRVGVIIERQLCSLHSDQYGARCGEVLHTLSQGQTLSDVASAQAEARKARRQEIKDRFRKAMCEVRRMKSLLAEHREDAAKAEILGSLVCDCQKAARKVLAEL